MTGLAGKVAFITGVARGQGRSHALRLAEAGVDIIGVDIAESIATVPYPLATKDDLEETVRAVEAVGGQILARAVDVRDLAGLQTVTDDGVARFGRLDIVIANAGISGPAATLEMSEQVWQDMIDVNLTGVWKTLRAGVPHIVKGGRGGSVVLISSLAAVRATENTAHYSAAKAGLVGLMRVLAKELAPQGIRVNTVHPTTVATEMVLNDSVYRLFRPELENPGRADFEVAARTMNRMDVPAIEVEDVTEVVMLLVSDGGRYITGSTQLVDAGGSL
ncbi:mycofactocin-coupled SDR family oxidoreductase [Pseudonocardia sp. GCM10023141]|uniref:mycofactocin-coupled SDR family oxidoreductase n=1 Tax=Pseudonocardia sp. GCM10023141 TaxID=3252653 RepID=UPI003609CA45